MLNGYGMVSVAFLLVMWAFDFVQLISYPFAMGSAWLGLDSAVQMIVLDARQSNIGAFSLWAGIISTNVAITSLFFWTVYTLSDESHLKRRLGQNVHYKAHKPARWRIVILRTYAQVVFNGESTCSLKRSLRLSTYHVLTSIVACACCDCYISMSRGCMHAAQTAQTVYACITRDAMGMMRIYLHAHMHMHVFVCIRTIVFACSCSCALPRS